MYASVDETIIGSDNGLSPGRRQAAIWTSAGILLIAPLGTNFSEVLIEIQIFSFRKMHFKMSSVNWRPFCLGLNVLKLRLRKSVGRGHLPFYDRQYFYHRTSQDKQAASAIPPLCFLYLVHKGRRQQISIKKLENDNHIILIFNAERGKITINTETERSTNFIPNNPKFQQIFAYISFGVHAQCFCYLSMSLGMHIT